MVDSINEVAAGDSQELEIRLQQSKQALDNLASYLHARFIEFEKERRPLEQRWLKSYRQYKGAYDPEILNKIPKNRSKAYPRHTRVKVNAMLSKLMEMLFPRSEKNWGLDASKFPNLPKDELNALLMALRGALPPQEEMADHIIEQAVREWAKQRAQAMEDKVSDQLKQINYVPLVRKVVKSAIMYGLGILKGPMVRNVQRRTWKMDPETGLYRAQVYSDKEPDFGFVRIWDFYPDLTARDYSSFTDAFERFKFSRHDVVNLIQRKDFMSSAIKEYLNDHTSGNYRERTFEWELRTATPRDPHTTANVDERSYDVRSFRGFIPANKLQAVGLDIPESDMYKDAYAEIWMLDQTIIKVGGNPYKNRDVPFYHTFVLDEDEDTGTIGESLPEVIRDSQMMTCAGTRMMLDNASVVCGPMVEVNMDRIDHTRQTDFEVKAFQVFYTEDSPESGKGDAVKNITIDSHLAELLQIIKYGQELMDAESFLPPASIGNVQNSEAFRTSGGVSQIMGAANLHPKDIVRSFDNFTESVINSIYEWNMEFSRDENIKGDMSVVARGATSLVAKELRAQILQQLLSQMPPETRRVWVDESKLLIRILESNDLDPEEVLNSPEKAQQIMQTMQQEQQQTHLADTKLVNARAEKLNTDSKVQVAKAESEGSLTPARMKEIMAKAEQALADASHKSGSTRIEAAKLLASLGENNVATG